MSQARALDHIDPLKAFRDLFIIADSTVYLDGNSLGRLPIETSKLMREVLEVQWGHRLVRSWGEGWMDLPRRLGTKLEKILGAETGSVVLADSTSVCFFKLLVAALRAREGRTAVVTDGTNFPSDLYVLQSVQSLIGHLEIKLVGGDDDAIEIAPEAVEAQLDRNTALLTLSHVEFKSGFLHDLKRLTAAAHACGALVLWDLSHSVGVVPINLAECGVDLAVGCTYKYLNGGPGAPAFIYVSPELQEKLTNPISGWLGHRAPFDFDHDYAPASGISKFITGTPPILSSAAIEKGLDLVLEAGLPAIREKSVHLTTTFLSLAQELLVPRGFEIASPRDAGQRGSHVALRHPEALRISQALIQEKAVIPDFRRPNNLRFGFAPLYNSFADAEVAIESLQQIVDDRLFEKYPTDLSGVT